MDVGFQSIVEQLPLVTYVKSLGPNGRRLYVSPQVERLLGYEPEQLLAGEPPTSALVHQDDWELFADEIDEAERGLRDFESEYRMVARDDRVVWVLDRTVVVRNEAGEPIAIQGALVDVTERRRLEEQLAHAQRMQAVGTLAGGIAHDFNNLLLAIIGYGELARQRVGELSELQEVQRAAERAASLTRRLLAFSRDEPVEARPTDVTSAVIETKEMLCRLIPESITLSTRLASGLTTVRIDAAQLEQVIVNLVVNARDAMPDGGQIEISTALVDLVELPVDSVLEARPGRYVRLAVSDTGNGLDPELRSRIFEPFFTTKPPGQGTGLGLAMVYSVTRNAGGFIRLLSEVGSGTTVEVYLPTELSVIPPTSAPESADETADRGETVLVVDDEEIVRRLMARSLSQRGYEVIEARGPNDALETARDPALRIDILVTDVVMPEMRGTSLAQRVAESRPDVPVLFVSGYSEDALNGFQGRASFLSKPFAGAQLAGKVRELLGGTGSSSRNIRSLR